MFRTIIIPVIATMLIGCTTSAVTISKKGGKELRAVPFPEMAVFKVPGQLQHHSIKTIGQKCNPVKVERRVMGPTGNILYADVKGNFFTSEKLTVAFHSNGTLSSVGGEVSSTSEGIASFVEAATGIVSVLERTKGVDAPPNCDSGFVPTGPEVMIDPSDVMNLEIHMTMLKKK